jgi:hypothetical protein
VTKITVPVFTNREVVIGRAFITDESSPAVTITLDGDIEVDEVIRLLQFGFADGVIFDVHAIEAQRG